MKETTKVIAENIKEHRNTLGITQLELGNRLGYSEKAISKWERGVGAPPTVILPELAKQLNTTIDGLFYERTGQIFFLGIDGGGTKTDFALADSNGTLIAHTTLGASNPNDVGFSRMSEVLRAGILEVCDGYSLNEIQMFAGLAGFSDENASRISDFLSQFGFSSVKCGNDAQNAVAACFDDGDGVAVIMGTGSITYAKKGHALFRIGGYGYLFGDAGSGFAIGRDVVLAALQFEDGSGQPTVLYDYVKEMCGGKTVLENLDAFYRDGKRAIAKYAPLAVTAYSMGDNVAIDIMDKNIQAVLQMIKGASNKIDKKNIDVILCGGLVQKNSLICELIENALRSENKKYSVRICNRPLYWGALKLAGMTEKIKQNK